MDKNLERYMKETKGKQFLKFLKEGRELLIRKETLFSSYNLTPSAWVREALKNADSTHDRLDVLKKHLTERDRAFAATLMAYRNAKKYIASPNLPKPPADMKRLSWLAGSKFDLVVAELSSIGSSFFELFALASREVATDHPEFFGPVEDWDSYQAELQDVKEKYIEVLKKIESSYDASDLIVSEIDNEGYGRVSFKISKGTVPLGKDSAERLLIWLRDNLSVKL